MAAQQLPGQAFWIDALCINQSDDNEKSVQVQRMGSMYKNANDVLIWLGHHEGIAALFEWAGKPRNAIGQAMVHVFVEKTLWHLRSYVLELAKHPYWRRAWVIQEMMLAKTIMIACGPVIIQPDALLRCVSTSVLSSTVLDKEEWLVHLNLKARLESRVRYRTASFPKHFWNVFGLSGETPNCSDPRDRIYSVLTVTGQDESFTVDYKEDVVSLFWRCLHHFAPEADPAKVQRLWSSLELTPSAVADAAEAKGSTLQMYIPMRQTEILPDMRRQLRGLLRLQRTGLCGHDVYNFARAQIRGYSREDILLCPGTNNSLSEKGREGENIDLEGIHVLIHPLAPPEDGFTFTILNTTYGSFPQLDDTELWSNINDVESRIQKWSEVTRLAELNGFSNRNDDEWKSRPHFMLNLSHVYFVECVSFVQKFWKAKFKHSWNQ